MAEAQEVKKEEKKPSSGTVVWEEVLLLILGIIALLFVFIPRFFPTNDTKIESNNNIVKNFDLKDTFESLINPVDQTTKNERGEIVNVNTPNLIEESKSRLSDFFKNLSILFFSTIIFIILLLGAIVYYYQFRTELIINNYKKKFYPEDEKIEAKNEEILEKIEPDNNGIINPRWQLVGKYYNSANQSDWKLAILEADIMLYEVLDKSGFQGISIGEMLKNTDRSKLATLDNAWSAHKIRNEIAHQGLDFILTRTKVEEAIANYEKVFEELNFI